MKRLVSLAAAAVLSTVAVATAAGSGTAAKPVIEPNTMVMTRYGG